VAREGKDGGDGDETHFYDLAVDRPSGLAEETVLDEHPVRVEFFYYWCCGLCGGKGLGVSFLLH
jgi:hypothetical protein